MSVCFHRQLIYFIAVLLQRCLGGLIVLMWEVVLGIRPLFYQNLCRNFHKHKILQHMKIFRRTDLRKVEKIPIHDKSGPYDSTLESLTAELFVAVMHGPTVLTLDYMKPLFHEPNSVFFGELHEARDNGVRHL